ncbi:MAG: pyridoxamine 5'-phosphate oxidase family protein [Lachnospiraceae bacterium]|nr:pyridoxamine 5'-phosphate oxidase family protein [Lachnospiraceae bacterium]
MFRKMRRFRQEISKEECIEVLKNEKRGVLSILGEDGYPYGIPLNHWFCEEDGRLYFHGAKEGKKIDSIALNDKASYCVYDKGYCKPGEWSLNVKSIILFGRIKPVTDENRARKICTELVRKFIDDEEYLEEELKKSFGRVQCLEFIPEHMSGKLVNES